MLILKGHSAHVARFRFVLRLNSTNVPLNQLPWWPRRTSALGAALCAPANREYRLVTRALRQSTSFGNKNGRGPLIRTNSPSTRYLKRLALQINCAIPAFSLWHALHSFLATPLRMTFGRDWCFACGVEGDNQRISWYSPLLFFARSRIKASPLSAK